MKVAFNNSLDDMVAVYEALLLKQRATGQAVKPAKQIGIIVFCFVVLSGLAWLATEGTPYVLMAILFVISFSLIRNTGRSATRKRLRAGLIKSHPEGEWRTNITEINDAGITHICQDNVTAFWWSQVTEIVREEEYLRFYTHQCSVSQIPLRVFRAPQDIAQFESEANRLWEAHKYDPPLLLPEISGIIKDDVSTPGCLLVNPVQPALPTELP